MTLCFMSSWSSAKSMCKRSALSWVHSWRVPSPSCCSISAAVISCAWQNARAIVAALRRPPTSKRCSGSANTLYRANLRPVLPHYLHQDFILHPLPTFSVFPGGHRDVPPSGTPNQRFDFGCEAIRFSAAHSGPPRPGPESYQLPGGWLVTKSSSSPTSAFVTQAAGSRFAEPSRRRLGWLVTKSSPAILVACQRVAK